jgi:hypothetical protein
MSTQIFPELQQRELKVHGSFSLSFQTTTMHGKSLLSNKIKSLVKSLTLQV